MLASAILESQRCLQCCVLSFAWPMLLSRLCICDVHLVAVVLVDAVLRGLSFQQVQQAKHASVSGRCLSQNTFWCKSHLRGKDAAWSMALCVLSEISERYFGSWGIEIAWGCGTVWKSLTSFSLGFLFNVSLSFLKCSWGDFKHSEGNIIHTSWCD